LSIDRRIATPPDEVREVMTRGMEQWRGGQTHQRTAFAICNQEERAMTTETNRAGWMTAAILVGRLIFASVFIMAASFKLMDINATAGYIASAGFALSTLLAWLAALFELALIACFLTGAYFSEAALVAAAYVLFLAFSFHGPSHWAGNQDEFGFFVDHFTFVAGLLFAAAHGPGRVLAMRRGWISEPQGEAIT
jgi:putative oxidoreductase